MDRHRADLVPARDFGRDLVFEVVPEKNRGAKPLPGLAPVNASGSILGLFDRDVKASVTLPETSSPIAIEIPEGTELAALELHYGAAPRVPVERVEILRETETGAETIWATEPGWPALTELVSGLLSSPRDGTQTIYFDSGGPPISGRILLRLDGLDSEPPELTEIELLAPAVGN
jgi:hypothetical protein